MTTPPWIPKLETYRTTVEQRPALVCCDMAVMEHIPVADHPVRLTVDIALRQPDAAGLPSAAEQPDLNQVQERLAAMIGYDLEGWYVGHVATAGHVEMCLYMPTTPEPNSLATCLAECSGPYATSHRFSKDPRWKFYAEALWPDRKLQQHLSNERVLAQLRDSGDDLGGRRNVVHSGFFEKEAAAKACATALAAQGFTVTPPESTEFGAWRLEFGRPEQLLPAQIDATTDTILDVLDEMDGDYDGWVCATETPV